VGCFPFFFVAVHSRLLSVTQLTSKLASQSLLRLAVLDWTFCPLNISSVAPGRKVYISNGSTGECSRNKTKQNKRHTDSRSNERKIHCQKALFCELESFCRCFQHSGTNPVLFRYSDPVPGNGCHEQLDPCNPAILLRRTQLGKRTFWKPTDDANGVCVCARAWCSCCLFSMRRRVCSHVSVCGSHRDFVAQNIPRI